MKKRRVWLGFLLLVAALVVWSAQACVRDPGALINVSTTLEPSDSQWQVESVRLTTERGLVLECTARRPAADSGRRLEAALVAGGVNSGRRAALLVGESFRGVAFACDYPWINPGRYGVLRLALRLPRLRAELVGTPLAHRVAADYLLSRGDVDTARLTGIGTSFGVPTVAAWAAADSRVHAVALLYGGARLDVLLEHAARRARWPATIRLALAPLVARALGPLEPERTVPRIAPRPRLVIIAPDDERMPREASEALAAAAGPDARVIRLSGGHLHPREPELLAALTDSTVAWLAGAGGAVRAPR